MRALLLLLAVVAATACYQPAARLGAPCSSTGDCPQGQLCDVTRSPPVCVDQLSDDGGPPVQCTTSAGCPADAPVCSGNLCRRCAADAECDAGVCRELTGRCVADADVLFVAPTGTDFGNSCTRATPCATLPRALSLIAGARRTIRVADGVYPDKVTLPNPDGSATPIALSGEDSDPAGAEIGGTNGEGMQTDPNTVAELEGLRISDVSSPGLISRGDITLYRVAVARTNSHGVDARSGKLRLYDCSITGNKQRGLQLNGNVTADIQRTLVTGNTAGGIEVSGTTLSLINSIIGGNGSQNTGLGGISISSNATVLAFRFNTIASNLASTISGNSPGVQCNGPVTLDSSIFANNLAGTAPEVSANCQPRYSLFLRDAPMGEGNLVGDPAFASPLDFHITPSSAARDRADPAATEPRDVDNQPRVDGRRDIGADEL